MLSNDELKLELTALREYARSLHWRTERRQARLKELGLDYAGDMELMMLTLLSDQVGREIGALREELKSRQSQSLTRPVARVQLKQDSRDSIERMMRGNYNRYGGEEL